MDNIQVTQEAEAESFDSSAILEREEVFHDDWARTIDVKRLKVFDYFEACTAPEGRKIVEWLGDVTDKRLLDLGCGAGEAAVYFALRGASVVASDLSTGMLEVASRLAEVHGTSIEVQQSSADALQFPDESFDIVYCANLLHHVEIAQTLDEIRRILRPGGVLVSWDPVAHNPLINVYRRMAMGVRTEDEHPLHMSDLNLFRSRFSEVTYECFWFCTLWIFLRFFLIERVHPNSQRYWKKIIDEHERLAPTYNRLEALDRRILGRIPFLKRYCWNIAVHAKK